MPLTESTRLVLSRTQVVPNDPYWSNVSLLLHGDGANGSTTITDSSGSPKTVTAVGDAKISTAQSRFGGSSIFLDGNGDYLTVRANAASNFGTDNFTIEAWIYPATTTGATIVGGRGPSLGTLMLALESTQLRLGRNNVAWDIQSSNLTWASQWYHIAAVKSSGTVYLFRDGELLVSAVNAQAYNLTETADANFAVGARQLNDAVLTTPTAFFSGYIDDLRITKGVARYTANFTPSTAPFPDI